MAYRQSPKGLVMFSRNTVLILGAGASKPYGFPLGTELVRLLVGAQRQELLLKRWGVDPNEFGRFQEELHRSRFTIDAFLEHRNEFLTIGKLAIAQEIGRCESEGRLFGTFDWYDLLLEKIAPDRETLARNKLTIFTFNYDRSLEHYLHSGIMSRFGITSEEAAELLKPITIQHVYGRLGPLPWQGKHHSDFAPPMKYGESAEEAVRESADGIRLINERKDDVVSESNEKLSTIIERSVGGAKTVYFLGFGFHPENMAWFKTTFRQCAVRATGFGLTPVQRKSIQMRCGVAFLEHSGMTINDFLQNEALFYDD